jgi:hypothetical protein
MSNRVYLRKLFLGRTESKGLVAESHMNLFDDSSACALPPGAPGLGLSIKPDLPGDARGTPSTTSASSSTTRTTASDASSTTLRMPLFCSGMAPIKQPRMTLNAAPLKPLSDMLPEGSNLPTPRPAATDSPRLPPLKRDAATPRTLPREQPLRPLRLTGGQPAVVCDWRSNMLLEGTEALDAQRRARAKRQEAAQAAERAQAESRREALAARVVAAEERLLRSQARSDAVHARRREDVVLDRLTTGLTSVLSPRDAITRKALEMHAHEEMIDYLIPPLEALSRHAEVVYGAVDAHDTLIPPLEALARHAEELGLDARGGGGTELPHDAGGAG